MEPSHVFTSLSSLRHNLAPPTMKCCRMSPSSLLPRHPDLHLASRMFAASLIQSSHNSPAICGIGAPPSHHLYTVQSNTHLPSEFASKTLPRSSIGTSSRSQFLIEYPGGIPHASAASKQRPPPWSSTNLAFSSFALPNQRPGRLPTTLHSSVPYTGCVECFVLRISCVFPCGLPVAGCEARSKTVLFFCLFMRDGGGVDVTKNVIEQAIKTGRVSPKYSHHSNDATRYNWTRINYN